MWKVFISHTPEDNDFVGELAHELEERQISVMDGQENIVNWGDSLIKAMEKGFQETAYGILVLSRDFLSKLWTKRELDGLVSLGGNNLLTIWRNISKEEVARYSEALAEMRGISAEEGVKNIAEAIADVVYKPAATNEQFTKGLEQMGAKTLSPSSWELSTLMMHNFSDSELRDICIYLDVDFHNSGESKSERIHHLISRLKRRGDLEKLIEMLKTLKPQVDWSAASLY
ncbi:MAG: toll/interleukin-1 receptor domain-containing protein [Anaerolineales bacterium]|nr:toll/interleukin-1 receptor domain-containing protein [Anaerolineales bacterium]